MPNQHSIAFLSAILATRVASHPVNRVAVDAVAVARIGEQVRRIDVSKPDWQKKVIRLVDRARRILKAYALLIDYRVHALEQIIRPFVSSLHTGEELGGHREIAL